MTNTQVHTTLSIPEILLPSTNQDLSKWAVIACDQYTQDREYWKKTAEIVGDSPSTLSMILPEVYLEDSGRDEKLAAIRKNMNTYLANNVFAEAIKGFIYLERKTTYGRKRNGLMVTIDLDSYEWKPGSKALIRATEATIQDRIPPRMEIRRGAPLEIPHIMLLVNDPKKTLIEAIGSVVRVKKPLYDTPLMHNAGSITGWSVSTTEEISQVQKALAVIAEKNTAEDGSCFLFAVGDGNHSLATAKAVWEEFRDSHQKEAAEGLIDLENHSARFALVELVNLFDEGLTFEPIHRVVFGTTAKESAQFLAAKLGGTIDFNCNLNEIEKIVASSTSTCFGFIDSTGCCILKSPHPALAVSRLQPALDDFLTQNAELRIDYIHGAEEVFRLGKEKNTVSILLPPVEKDSFFSTIDTGGPLPRKSFSMGEASEKRFYLECRKLF
ncbi:MAG TPA: DUF1015 domain-containing protein [Treponemataceae bacterium]|nr:DUF1015 domain-containing protein [Treponemataceae bacterium]